MNTSIDAIAYDIKNWADKVFPDRTDASMFLKLYGEVAELIATDDKNVESEVADLLIMILDFAKRKNISIAQAIDTKMKINRNRVWTQDPIGTFSHVKERKMPGTSDAQLDSLFNAALRNGWYGHDYREEARRILGEYL